MNEILLARFGSSYTGVGIGAEVVNDESTIKFTAGDGMKNCLTDPLMTDNGKTIGERNIDWLHEQLDEWIMKQLEKAHD